jgi:hypothetical protein
MSAGPRNRPAVAGLAAGLAVALLLGGCAGRRTDSAQTGPSPQGTTSPTSRGALRVWIAVFETAADPNDLDTPAEELMEKAGTAVVVAPEGCFGELRGAGDIRPGDYVLAVTADSRSGLESAVGRSDREPILRANVEDLCPL